MLRSMSLRISEASPSAVMWGPPSDHLRRRGAVRAGDLPPVARRLRDRASTDVRQPLVEVDVLRRPHRLGEDQQQAVVAREVVAARPVDWSAPRELWRRPRKISDRPSGSSVTSSLTAMPCGVDELAAQLAPPAGGCPRRRACRQRSRPCSSRKSTALGKKVAQQLLGLADPVLHALSSGSSRQAGGEVVGKRLVGIDHRALGDAHRDQQEGVAAEVLERLDVGLDRRVVLRQQAQHVGVEATAGRGEREREADQQAE